MFILKMTSQFKKDLKRIQNQPIKIQHLKQIDAQENIIKLVRLGSHAELF